MTQAAILKHYRKWRPQEVAMWEAQGNLQGHIEEIQREYHYIVEKYELLIGREMASSDAYREVMKGEMDSYEVSMIEWQMEEEGLLEAYKKNLKKYTKEIKALQEMEED